MPPVYIVTVGITDIAVIDKILAANRPGWPFQFGTMIARCIAVAGVGNRVARTLGLFDPTPICDSVCSTNRVRVATGGFAITTPAVGPLAVQTVGVTTVGHRKLLALVVYTDRVPVGWAVTILR